MDTSEVFVEINVAQPLEALVDAEWIRAAVRAAITCAREDAIRPQGNEWTGERSLSTSVRITGDEEMRCLNNEYRGVDRTTDVLSFAFLEHTDNATLDVSPDWPVQLGDLIVSWPYAERQARELGHSLPTEVAWLVIHGTLQLLGYHHDTDARAEHMEGVERKALAFLGLNVS